MRCFATRATDRTSRSTYGGAEAKAPVHSEFRDGNVPAGREQRMLQEFLEALPAVVEKVRMRSDTTGYQHELL